MIVNSLPGPMYVHHVESESHSTTNANTDLPNAVRPRAKIPRNAVNLVDGTVRAESKIPIRETKNLCENIERHVRVNVYPM